MDLRYNASYAEVWVRRTTSPAAIWSPNADGQYQPVLAPGPRHSRSPAGPAFAGSNRPRSCPLCHLVPAISAAHAGCTHVNHMTAIKPWTSPRHIRLCRLCHSYRASLLTVFTTQNSSCHLHWLCQFCCIHQTGQTTVATSQTRCHCIHHLCQFCRSCQAGLLNIVTTQTGSRHLRCSRQLYCASQTGHLTIF